MNIIRPLVLLLLKYNINLQTEHMPCVNNILADTISRFQVTQNMLQLYGMRLYQTDIPTHLTPENFRLF